MRKILVFGAGVIGSMIAARLQQAGNDVTILARGSRFDEIQKNGIVVESLNKKTFTTTYIPVVKELGAEDAYDLILVVIRRSQLDSVLPILAANRNSMNILFLGNNVRGIPNIVAALGKERVLMGFGGIGGLRKNGVIQYLDPPRGRIIGSIIAGELDGSISERLLAIADVFQNTGFKVEFEKNIDAWLKVHFAIVGPMAGAIYMAGGDNYRLAQTNDALLLMIRGIKEGFRVLRVLGVPLVPKRIVKMTKIPEPLLLIMLKRMMKTLAAEVSLAGHANAARDEMSMLAEEFKGLIQQSGMPTPVLDKLFSYYSPVVPAIPAGSQTMRPDWKPILAVLATIGGVLSLGLLIGWRLFTGRKNRK